MSKQRNKKLVQLAGEYAVASELCQQGWLALVPPQGWPRVDIIATNQKGQTLQVQVKTKVGGNSVFFPTGEIEHPVVFVKLGKLGEAAKFFIVPGEECPRIRQEDFEEYLQTHPSSNPDIAAYPSTVLWEKVEPFEDRWDLIQD